MNLLCNRDKYWIIVFSKMINSACEETMSSKRSSGMQHPVITRLFSLCGYRGAQRWSASAVHSSQREEDACFISICHTFAELKMLCRSSFTWSDRYLLTSDSEYVQLRCGETGHDISRNGALPIWIFYLTPIHPDETWRFSVTFCMTHGGKCRLTKGQVWSLCGIGPAYWPGADCNVNPNTGGMQMVSGATGLVETIHLLSLGIVQHLNDCFEQIRLT